MLAGGSWAASDLAALLRDRWDVNLELCGHELVEAADGAAGLGLALHHTDLAEPAGVPTATSSLGPRLLCLTLRPRAEAVAGSKGEAASSLCPRS